MELLYKLPHMLWNVQHIYSDESEQHTAQGLMRMVWGAMTAITISVLISMFVLAPSDAQRAVARIAGIYVGRTHFFQLLAFFITGGSLAVIVRYIHRGNLRRASVAFVVLVYVVSFLNYIPHHFDDPVVMLVSLPLVAAGVLLDERGLRNMVIAVVAGLFVMLVFHELGMMTNISRSQLSRVETFIYGMLVVMFNGIMINTFSGHQRILLHRNLALTHDLRELNTALAKSEAELQVANADLEKRVYERTEQLLRATEEAERANTVKSAFLASMSHELRTPLNAIINFSKFLKRGIPGPVNEEQEQLITSIAESGQHLLNLINDVLDMSKIESGSLKLFVEENIDLKEVIQSAVKFTTPFLMDKPVELRLEVQDDLPLLTGDRKRLLQIMLNILSNACKFTDEGCVTVNARRENNHLLIAVEDTGMGIAPEDYSGVFEAFRQTQSGLRQGGGTGLGMPICKKLVEAHEGKLWFESQVGKGTKFVVELPLPEREKETA